MIAEPPPGEAYREIIREQTTEIERLLLKHEKEKHLLLTVLDKQTTEIERLKAEVQMMTEQAIRFRDMAQHNEFLREQYRALIIDLAEALGPNVWMTQDMHSLLKRAREATK